MFLVTQDQQKLNVNKFPEGLYDKYSHNNYVSELGYDVDDMATKYHKSALMDRSREYLIGEEDPKMSTSMRSRRILHEMEGRVRPDHSELFIGSYDRENTITDSMREANRQSQAKIKMMWDRNKITDKFSDAQITEPRISERERRNHVNKHAFADNQERFRNIAQNYLDYQTDDLRSVARVHNHNRPSYEDSAIYNNNIESRFGTANCEARDHTSLNRYVDNDLKDHDYGRDHSIEKLRDTNSYGSVIPAEIEDINEKIYASTRMSAQYDRSISNAGEGERMNENSYANAYGRTNRYHDQGAFSKFGAASQKLYDASRENGLSHRNFNDQAAFMSDFSIDAQMTERGIAGASKMLRESTLTPSEVRALGMIKTDFIERNRDRENTSGISSAQNAPHKHSAALLHMVSNASLLDSYKIAEIKKIQSTDGNNVPIYKVTESDGIMHMSLNTLDRNNLPNSNAAIENMVKAFVSDVRNKAHSHSSLGLSRNPGRVADYSSMRANEVSDLKNNQNDRSTEFTRSANNELKTNMYTKFDNGEFLN